MAGGITSPTPHDDDEQTTLPTLITSLFSPLSHLSALASKTSHSLLSPLGTHTGVDSHPHLEGVLIFNTVSLEGTFLKGFSAVQEANLMGGDEFCILNHELKALNRGGSVHFVSSGVHKDLHFLDSTVAQTCRQQNKRGVVRKRKEGM